MDILRKGATIAKEYKRKHAGNFFLKNIKFYLQRTHMGEFKSNGKKLSEKVCWPLLGTIRHYEIKGMEKWEPAIHKKRANVKKVHLKTLIVNIID